MPRFKISDDRSSSLRNKVVIMSCLSDENEIILDGFMDGAVKQKAVGEHSELVYFDYGPVLLLMWDAAQYAVLNAYNYAVSVDERDASVYVLDDQRLLKSLGGNLESKEVPAHIWFEMDSVKSDAEKLKKLIEHGFDKNEFFAESDPLMFNKLEHVSGDN